MITGSCACGRVEYQVEAKPSAVNACHCGTCQRASGGPFLAFADFDTADVHWKQAPDIWASSKIAERGHCKVCGSAVSMSYLFEKNKIGLTLGTIKTADPPIARITHHIFLAEKAPWFVLPDDGAIRVDDFGSDFKAKIRKFEQELEGT